MTIRDRTRCGTRGLVLVIALVAPASLTGQDGSAAAPAQLDAQRLSAGDRIQLDGLLEEAAWAAAKAASGFRQREPSEGAEATEKTEVRVLFDEAHIYVGVLARDSRPGQVIARQLERDAPLGLTRFGGGGGDDAVQIVLDTFHDRRNAYYFATNPLGVQVDGLITDESESPDINWDGVWDVRARRSADGWSAEFSIPLRTLRFPDRDGPQTWGFNVQRVVIRKNEQSLWTAWSRDNEGLHRLSRAGELTGLELRSPGINAYVKPYILGEAGREFVLTPETGAEFDGKVGADAKLGLSSGLVLDLTVNTDFAQVEADDQQVDLTRFNLFFPEKREFFLENAGIFEFGAPSFFGPPDVLLFFSRRIGLEGSGFGAAQPVPIIAGARLSGRAGKQTLGLLDVVTNEEESVGAPLTNFAVARVKRDVGERSYVGAVATHRLEEGGTQNFSGGLDVSYWLSSPLEFRGFYGRSYDSEPGGDDYAFQAVLDYTGDWFGWLVQHLEVGPEMNPGMGFVRRHDVAASNAGFRLSPRPPIPGLRKIDTFNSFTYAASVTTREVRDRTWQFTVSPHLNSGDRGSFVLTYAFQRLAEGFELNPGVDVPAGDYEDWNISGNISTSPSRSIAGTVFGGSGGFWDGRRWQLGGGLRFNSPHFGLELDYTHDDIDVPGGAFTTDLIRSRIKLAVNTRLFGNALIQYNSQTGEVSANVRIDFIHRPGSDLFIVFNERRDIVDGRWLPASRAFIVKLTYLKFL